MNDLSSIDACY